MAKTIEIQEYTEFYKDRWDRFVLDESINGTFLQTRNFLEYHPADRFKDNSLLFLNGSNIIAVLPAHIQDDERKILNSHQGSTFGGIVVGKRFCKIGYMDLIFEKFESYLQGHNFKEVVLKQSGRIYQNMNSELLDYYLFMNNYTDLQEVGYYIDFDDYSEDIISNFSSSRRRDYRYSLKNEFVFRELITQDEIKEFYEVLCDNYKKFEKLPVHTLNELLDFKCSRLPQNVKFYGVYHENELVAAGMVFLFGKQVFHTQYLAVMQNRTNLFVNEFLYEKLIETARNDGFSTMSFGTSTLEGGKVLNRPLAQFKEGFGTKEYVNRIYRKIL